VKSLEDLALAWQPRRMSETVDPGARPDDLPRLLNARADKLAGMIEEMASVTAIGSYVINFGHLEHCVMRLIEWLNGGQKAGHISTELLRLNWSDLVKRLRKDVCGSPIDAEVTRLLDDHNVESLGSLRHSLVHGSVSVSQPPTVAINRRRRDGSSSILLGTRGDIEQNCQHVIDLGAALDRFLPESFRRVTANLASGVVGLTREQAIAQGLDPDLPWEQQPEAARFARRVGDPEDSGGVEG
jgi:hypothetical protein